MAKQLTGIPTNITEYPNSFKRQGAFPLEANEIFYSLEAAQKYVGGNDTTFGDIAYVGQKVTVVENDKATLYIVQPKDSSHATPYLSKIEGTGESVSEETVRDIVDGYVDEAYLETVVKDYVDENNGTIVYLNTREHISKSVELQDVYPIQHKDSLLKVVSKNRLVYKTGLTSQEVNGITFSPKIIKTNDVYDDTLPYFTVSGTSSGAKSTTIELGEVDCSVQGKYTISLQGETNYGYIDTTQRKCYITYTLYDESNPENVVQTSKILTNAPVTIDTKEINCHKIKFDLYFNVYSKLTIDEQKFKLQVEFGDTVTPYTHPRTVEDCAGKTVNIYGRNLISPTETFTKMSSQGYINRKTFYTLQGLGVHYIQGQMTEDYKIEITESTISTDGIEIETPLLQGDDFTLIFNIISISDTELTVSDVQLVRGKTSYEEYSSYSLESVVSDENGNCDISSLKYPYSLVTLNNFDNTNDGLDVYVKYDPALSRDWVEKEIDKIYESNSHNAKLLESFDLRTVDAGTYIWKANNRLMYSKPLDNGGSQVMLLDYKVNDNTPIAIIDYGDSVTLYRVMYALGKISNTNGVLQDVDCVELRTVVESGKKEYVLTTYSTATTKYVQDLISSQIGTIDTYTKGEVDSAISSQDGKRRDYDCTISGLTANELKTLYNSGDTYDNNNENLRAMIDNITGTFIVEQEVSDNLYFEKWSNGIVKYYTNQSVTPSESKENETFSIDVFKNPCKTIISCNVDGYSLDGTCKCHLMQIVDNESDNKYTINGLFDHVTANIGYKVFVSIVGMWK